MKGNWLLILIFFLILFPQGVLPQEEEEEENIHVEMLEDQFLCLDCHTRLPKEGETSPDYFLVDFPSENCLGCHSDVEHSGVREHHQKEANPLPGDENGKIACFTCHDPHPQGVIGGRVVYDDGMGSRNRGFIGVIHKPDAENRVEKNLKMGEKRKIFLRIPNAGGRICAECHQPVEEEANWRRNILGTKYLRFPSYP